MKQSANLHIFTLTSADSFVQVVVSQEVTNESEKGGDGIADIRQNSGHDRSRFKLFLEHRRLLLSLQNEYTFSPSSIYHTNRK